MNCARMAIVCGALCFLATGHGVAVRAEEAKLEIRGIKLIYDEFSPVRKNADFFPGERLTVRFDIHGFGVKDDGLADLEVSCRVVDALGKVRHAFSYQVKADKWDREDAFNRQAAFHMLPDDMRPGKYVLELSLEDRVTRQEASASIAFTVKPTELALVSPRFFYDEKRTCRAPLSGSVNQRIFFDCDVIGEDRSQGKIDLNASIDLVDAAGKCVFQRSQLIDILCHGDELPANISQHVIVHGWVHLQHPGKYTLRIAVLDKLTGRTASLELPLEVHDLEEPNELAAR
jgi:hypothetical protein